MTNRDIFAHLSKLMIIKLWQFQSNFQSSVKSKPRLD